MKFYLIAATFLVGAASAVPQGYGSSVHKEPVKKCKTVYDIEYVEKYEKKCHTEYE